MSAGRARKVQILLVEDSPEEALLAQEAFRDAGGASEVHVADDGEKALRFVRGEGNYAGAPRPDLILLDFNLPLKHGREVLAELKSDPDLSCIPVIVLTTSASASDRLTAYELSANAFIRKPVDLESFMGVVEAIDRFWLGAASLPPNPGTPAQL